MGVNYASISYKNSFLSSEFGEQLALKKFPNIEELVGRYVRGKRKGQLRGKICWYKIIKGGWIRTGAYDRDFMQASGFVQRQKVSFGFCIRDSWTDELIAADFCYDEDAGQALQNFNVAREIKKAEEVA